MGLLSCGLLVQQAPSYPAALHTALVCSALHPATKNPALGSLKSNSALALGQEFWLFHHVQCLMMFLVNVTQLVEYPLLLSHTILYFVTLDFAGVSECASWWIVRWFRVLQLPLHPPPFTPPPSWAPRYLLSVSILACPGQLFNLLPWRPGLWNHHSLLQP